MSADIIIALVAGLGGMLGWGFSEFGAKKSVDYIGTVSSLVWAHVFGTGILFALVFCEFLFYQTGLHVPSDPGEWLGLFFFGSLQAIVYYFAYKGFEKGEVSILSPIFASFAGLVALYSLVVFGEQLNGIFIVALSCVFAGVILMNIDIRKLSVFDLQIRTVPGLKEILIATVLATIWTLGWDKFSSHKDWMMYTTFMFLSMTIAAFCIARWAKVSLHNVKPAAWRYLWLIAIGEVVAYLAITLGYSSTTHTSIVAILSGASSLPTIILARVFLREKMTPLQMVSSLIIISGVVLLVLV